MQFIFLGREVLKRWTNLRDSFTKYKKKQIDYQQNGITNIKLKTYIYYNHLSYLEKLFDGNESVEDFEIKKEDEEYGDESLEGHFLAAGASSTSSLGPYRPKPKKHKISDESDFWPALESPQPCSKIAFLQSIMPHLRKLDDEEFLQFQVGVLKVIRDINDEKNRWKQ